MESLIIAIIVILAVITVIFLSKPNKEVEKVGDGGKDEAVVASDDDCADDVSSGSTDVDRLKDDVPDKYKRPDIIVFRVVGIFYRGKDVEDEALCLKEGDSIRLVKEPENDHSKLAIKVYTTDNVWLGYVGNPDNRKIFKDMEDFTCFATVIKPVIEYNDYNKQFVQVFAYYVIPNFEFKERMKREKRNAQRKAWREANKGKKQ